MNALITALNTDTDMVMVTLETGSETLAPVAWERAAYVLQLPPLAKDAEALRTALQDVLNHGRDAALVVTLDDWDLKAETVHEMVAAYCAAGDETWAVVTGNAMEQGHPVLVGRRMIELFLRGKNWSTAGEVLSANSQHVSTFKAATASAPPSV